MTYKVFLKVDNYISVSVDADSKDEAEEFVANNLREFYDQIRNVDVNDLDLEVAFGEASVESEETSIWIWQTRSNYRNVRCLW